MNRLAKIKERAAAWEKRGRETMKPRALYNAHYLHMAAASMHQDLANKAKTAVQRAEHVAQSRKHASRANRLYVHAVARDVDFASGKAPGFADKGGELHTKYPKFYKRALQSSRDAYANTGDPAGEYGSLHHIRQQPPSKQRAWAEAAAVYHTLTDNGPDLSFEVLKRKLHSVRRVVPRGDILGAHESGKLVQHLEKAGLLGPRGDSLRHSGDKYFHSLPSDWTK